MGSPDPRSRLLRGVQAWSAVPRQRSRLVHRLVNGFESRARRSRRARASLRQDPGRPTCRLRTSPLRGTFAGRRRRDARHSGGNCAFTPPLRDPGIEDRDDGRRSADGRGRPPRMSDDQTFERNARQWLEIGPSHVPTRIVDAALRTVATTPQQRTLRAPRRPQLLRNQRSLSFAAATAILALTLGGGYLFLRPIQSQVAVPVPTPTATPSSSSATQATPVPTPDSTPSSNIDVSSLGAAIQTKWLPLGDTRPSSGAEHGLMGAMIISDKNVQLEIYYASLNNSWSIDPSGTFQMTLESTATDLAHDRWQCATGD